MIVLGYSLMLGNSFLVNGSSGNDREKYYFDAAALKPEDLQSSNNTALVLLYNITKGGKFVDYPVNWDSSWR